MRPRKSFDRTRWLTIADVAELLQVSERTVRRWLDAGDLAAHKLGRQWRISDKDLEQYLLSRRQGGRPFVL
jgi:excisionase family DNA binding protein